MYKKIINIYIFILLGIMPLSIHFFSDYLFGLEFEYISYFQEIYFFNVFMFAYIYINIKNKRNLLNKFFSILQFVTLANFLILTSIYGISFHEQFIELKKGTFAYLIISSFVDMALALFVEIMNDEIETDLHYSESRYKKFSENRYERYLLERIDEKLNSIKNQKNEKTEENNDILNSEELLNGSDILAEMLKNHIEIKEYFRISKSQSKFSFYFSIMSSVIGIIVVIIAATGIVVFEKLGISIIAAVSGATTEIISGIVLWIHNKSALQLNYYYDSLHENEKFLSAVNIADKLSEEKKEDMYIEIIRKQIDIQSKDRENKTSVTGKE